MRVKLGSLREILRFLLSDPSLGIGFITLVTLLSISLAGLILNPYSPDVVRDQPLQPPSLSHILGTDDVGRDVASMIFRGVFTSMLIGLLAALATVLIGLALGVVAATAGGLLDSIIMRVVDFLLATPSLVLALILIAILKSSIYNVILVIAITTWPGIARIVRAHSLQVLSAGYVEAARALGASKIHLILRHLIPAATPITLAAMVTSVRSAILLEAGLSFLGLGDPNMISLGTILFYARRSASLAAGAWWLILPAGLVITLIVFSLTMISLGVERAFSKR